MKRWLSCAVGAVLVLGLQGCAFTSGIDETLVRTGDRPLEARLVQSKAWFRRFTNKSVVAREQATAVSSTGATASAVSETVGETSEVPTWILEAAQTALPFRAISPVTGMGSAPDYILEGSLDYDWNTRWWTWVQGLDIWLHAWLFPTCGRYLELDFSLSLYDSDHQLLRKWVGHRTVKYVGQVWWLFNHGGAYGAGFEEGYEQYLKEVFPRIGAELRAELAKLPPPPTPAAPEATPPAAPTKAPTKASPKARAPEPAPTPAAPEAAEPESAAPETPERGSK